MLFPDIRAIPFLVCMLFCLVAAATAAGAQDRGTAGGRTYPQLMAMVYPSGKPLPRDMKIPTQELEPLDRAGLPSGAVISSIAKDRRGETWVATDQGAFRTTNG